MTSKIDSVLKWVSTNQHIKNSNSKKVFPSECGGSQGDVSVFVGLD